MGFMDKAKDLAGEHRDKIQEQGDKVIDGKLDGDKADKAKDGLNKASIAHWAITTSWPFRASPPVLFLFEVHGLLS